MKNMSSHIFIIVMVSAIAFGVAILSPTKAVESHQIHNDWIGEAKSASTSYYLTLEFVQSSFTLNIGQHIRDSANSFTITMPTTKEFYDSVKIGDVIGDKFKAASFVLTGHIGKRKVVVKNKFT